MADASTVRLWHSLSFRDVEPMMAWLSAIGFEEHAVHRDETDPAVVVHGEMLWPRGGGIMFGSHRESSADGGDLTKQPGTGAAYLVTADDGSVDRVHALAIEAGGRTLRAPEDQDYGGRSASFADPEGNTWSVGSYQPT